MSNLLKDVLFVNYSLDGTVIHFSDRLYFAKPICARHLCLVLLYKHILPEYEWYHKYSDPPTSFCNSISAHIQLFPFEHVAFDYYFLHFVFLVCSLHDFFLYAVAGD